MMDNLDIAVVTLPGMIFALVVWRHTIPRNVILFLAAAIIVAASEWHWAVKLAAVIVMASAILVRSFFFREQNPAPQAKTSSGLRDRIMSLRDRHSSSAGPETLVDTATPAAGLRTLKISNPIAPPAAPTRVKVQPPSTPPGGPQGRRRSN
jgi:membrane protein implicated in regulation of membrane protease activity